MFVEMEKQAGQSVEQVAESSAPVETEKPKEGQITLGEDGALNIPDGFWDEVDRMKREDNGPAPKETEARKNPEVPEEKAAPVPSSGVPERYTPDELADAFVKGTVDPRKLSSEMVEAYNAIDAAMRRQSEARRIEAEMRPQGSQGPGQQPGAGAWAQLAEAAKELAARHYLGINPEDFDEFNTQHVAARYTAMQDIRDRANAMATQQQRAVQLQSQVAELWAGYRQTTPDIDEIGEKFFPVWRQKLTVVENQRVNEIFASSDMEKLKGLIDRVVSDYRGSKTTPKPVQSTGVQEAPPHVMGTAGGAASDDRGVVDAAEFGNMTTEEQAKWLVSNKFAG